MAVEIMVVLAISAVAFVAKLVLVTIAAAVLIRMWKTRG
jgi:hypothetical protein